MRREVNFRLNANLASHKIKLSGKMMQFISDCDNCSSRYLMLSSGKFIANKEYCKSHACGGCQLKYRDYIPYTEMEWYKVKGTALMIKNNKYSLFYTKTAGVATTEKSSSKGSPSSGLVWGLGVVSSKSGNVSAKVNFSTEPINVYNNALGALVGQIRRKNATAGTFLGFLNLVVVFDDDGIVHVFVHVLE